jgi:trk system potassium uptake protein TrkA
MDNIEWSTILKGEARFFSFVVSSKDSVNFKDMQLPEEAKIIYYYRDDKFFLVDKNTTFKIGDEVIILTNADNLPKLKKRWDKSLVVGVSR